MCVYVAVAVQMHNFGSGKRGFSENPSSSDLWIHEMYIVQLSYVLAFIFSNIYIALCLSNDNYVTINAIGTKYEPTWESLDSRPLPDWYQNAKIGIFVHWGVFSVPSFGSEWFWKNWKDNTSAYVEFMERNYPPGFTYQDFAPQFTAEFFDPDEWAEIFENSGARYVVLTSKHHEGYTLWPSAFSFSWNAMDVGPKRDLLGDLMKSIRYKTSLKFGLYHSLYEWYNPLYLQDKASGFLSQIFAKDKTMPELYELVNTYQPEVIWSDGDWEAPDSYWNSTEFVAWLYNESPVRDTVVVNDRWGKDVPCKHGDFYTCTDRYNPGVLVKHKWENCMTLDKHSWGYRRNAKLSDYLTTHELITTVVETVSCGGNILINVGPTKEGTITPIFQQLLRDLGTWLNVNAEAMYPAVPWTHQNDSKTSGVWYTKSSEADEGYPVFAVVLNWPADERLLLGSPQLSPGANITLLGTEGNLKWSETAGGIQVQFPPRTSVQTSWAWVIKMLQVKN
ncbi:alpha-L-fucosidase-like [Bacillus rossius redtenbacheri]|uniref:alpha-L-fucosidase-like n=1 Tax=Bacillus rossius redtenbacheri TaxID=93214 RepID=UPI002FDD6E4E